MIDEFNSNPKNLRFVRRQFELASPLQSISTPLSPMLLKLRSSCLRGEFSIRKAEATVSQDSAVRQHPSSLKNGQMDKQKLISRVWTLEKFSSNFKVIEQ